ncbi:MAG: DUF4397 domain-containing protein [Gemmatimonadales bacterium]
MIRKRLHWGVVALALLVLAGCSDKVASPRPPAGDLARLRLVNGASDAVALDVTIDGDRVIQGVGATGSSGYTDVPAGDRQLRVSVNGTNQQVVSRTVTLAKDIDYTLVVSGSLANPVDVLASDTAFIPLPNKVKIRLLNAALNAPPLDVYLTAPGADLANESPAVEPFLFGVDTTTFPGFLERDPGDYQVRFTDDGTLNVRVDTGPFTVTAGQVLSVILMYDDGGSLVARIVEETPTVTPPVVFIRVMHSAPSAPSVDVHVSDPGLDLALPHIVISPFQYGADSSTVTFLLPAHQQASVPVEVRFTTAGTSTLLASSGAFSVPVGEKRRVTLQPAQGGGLEAVVGPEP